MNRAHSRQTITLMLVVFILGSMQTRHAIADEDAMCVIELLYSSGSVWLYYAHHHENGTECPEFTQTTYPSAVELSPVPMRCDYGECFDPDTSLMADADEPTRMEWGLPLKLTDELKEKLATSKDNVQSEHWVKIILPNEKEIFARLAVLDIKVPIKSIGRAQDLAWKIERIAVGLHSEPPADLKTKAKAHAVKVRQQEYGSMRLKGMYEGEFGTTKCFILAAE